MIKNIELIRQLDDETCMSACLTMVLCAMGLDKTFKEVVEEFHENFSNGMDTPMNYLLRHGLIARSFCGLERYMLYGNIYILGVPSLNHVATMHSIVVDVRGTMEVFDPQMKKEKKYYVYGEDKNEKYWKTNTDAVALKHFVIDLEIVPGRTH